MQGQAASRTSWPEKTGLVGPLPGKMQLLSVALVAVLLEPYSDSGAMPDVTLVTSNSTYPAYPVYSPCPSVRLCALPWLSHHMRP